MKKLIVTAALLVGTVAALQAADAKEVWNHQCAKCHNKSGDGATKMGQKLKLRNLTDAKVQAELKDDKMFEAIKNGVKQDGKDVMKPATDVNDADIKALVALVRSMKK